MISITDVFSALTATTSRRLLCAVGIGALLIGAVSWTSYSSSYSGSRQRQEKRRKKLKRTSEEEKMEEERDESGPLESDPAPRRAVGFSFTDLVPTGGGENDTPLPGGEEAELTDAIKYLINELKTREELRKQFQTTSIEEKLNNMDDADDLTNTLESRANIILREALQELLSPECKRLQTPIMT